MRQVHPFIVPYVIAFKLILVACDILGFLILRFIKLVARGNRTEVDQPGRKFYNSQAWKKLRYATLNNQGRRCVSCGESRVKYDNGQLVSYHVDHIKPRSKHPHLALDPNNMMVMCSYCNTGKMADWEINHRLERGIN